MFKKRRIRGKPSLFCTFCKKDNHTVERCLKLMNTNRTNHNNSLPAEYGTNSTQVKFKDVMMLQGESQNTEMRKESYLKNKPTFESYANYYCDTDSDSSWGSDDDSRWEPDFESEEDNNSLIQKKLVLCKLNLVKWRI